MTRWQALEILKLFKGWNTGQKSVELAFSGIRTKEDDIYDARRKLLIKAYDTLNNTEENNPPVSVKLQQSLP